MVLLALSSLGLAFFSPKFLLSGVDGLEVGFIGDCQGCDAALAAARYLVGYIHLFQGKVTMILIISVLPRWFEIGALRYED